MTSFAQEKCHSISENVTLAQIKKFTDGKYSCAYGRFWWYDKGHAVNCNEYVVVRLIYKMFLQGLTAHTISLKLTYYGILTPGGFDTYGQNTVK